MQFWAVPYIVFYILMCFFWMVKTNRAILFWLYLWQLKEYHLGRFLAHFSTEKGKSLFLNPIFITKTAVAAIAFVSYGSVERYKTSIFSLQSVFEFSTANKNGIIIFIGAVFVIFAIEAVRAFVGILRKNFLQPVATKKSLMLIVLCHVLFLAAAIFIFGEFLGEMSLIDFAFAAFLLLLADILLPAVIGAVVLALQPLTIWEKSRILKKAEAVIASRPNVVVIGIAGSYGKSVTKELLAHLLAEKFNVLKTSANQNTEIGVAQTIIKELKPENQIFVCEIGAVHKGRVRQVGKIVKPKIAILTGINQQHMAVFGSQQNIVDGKFEIMDAVAQNGTTILNWNSKLVRDNFEAQRNRIKTGNIILAGKDISAQNIKTGLDYLAFDIGFKEKRANLYTNARGEYMVEPILLAAGGAVAAGMDFDEVAEILNKTDFKPFNIKTGKNAAGINIIDSTYSSNPDGVIAHLDYLKLWPGKKAIIMPCIIELGESAAEVHFQIGKKIAEICELAIITSKDRFREIKKGALSAGMKPENIIFSEKPAVIDKLIKNRLSESDTTLLEGRSPQSIIGIAK